MQINIEGIKKKEHHLIKEAIEYYAEALMNKRLCDNLTVDINLFNKEVLHDTVIANCGYLDDSVRPRWFDIDIAARRKSVHKILLVVAHEMVHLKQYATCELQERDRPYRYLWKGQLIDIQTNYWMHEHEIEALGREKGLYFAFCSHKKIDAEVGFD